MVILRIFPILHLFKLKRYVHYWISANLIFTARWMLMVVTGWLVLELTDSVFLVGLAGALQWLPMLVLGVFAGLVADWFDRKKVLIVSQIVQSLSCLALGWVIVTGLVQTWHVMLVSLVIGLGWAFDMPTRRSIVPDLVGPENVHRAIAVEISIMNMMSAVGAIAGGKLINIIGMGNCFLAIGSLYALSVVFLALMGRIASSSIIGDRRIRRIMSNLTDGVRYAFSHQTILAVMMVTVIINLLVLPYRHLLPVFSRDILNVGPEGLGYLTGVTGIGAFISSVTIGNISNMRRTGFLFLLGSFGFGAIIIAFAFSTVYSFSLGALFIIGFCLSMFATFQSTILLHLTSEEMRGRVMGILSLCIGTMPLGIIAFGALADILGAPMVVGVASALASVLVMFIFFVMPALRKN